MWWSTSRCILGEISTLLFVLPKTWTFCQGWLVSCEPYVYICVNSKGVRLVNDITHCVFVLTVNSLRGPFCVTVWCGAVRWQVSLAWPTRRLWTARGKPDSISRTFPMPWSSPSCTWQHLRTAHACMRYAMMCMPTSKSASFPER